MEQQQSRTSTDGEHLGKKRKNNNADIMKDDNTKRTENAFRQRVHQERLNDVERKTKTLRQRAYREGIDKAEKQTAKARNTAQQRSRREGMTSAQRQSATARNTARERSRREGMTSAERQSARTVNVAQQQRHRTGQLFMAGRRCCIDTFDASTVEPYEIGPQNIVCSYCGALGFKSEKKITAGRIHLGRLCCNQGQIQLPSYRELPPELHDLMVNQDTRSKYFRQHIRMFNSGLAMASLHVQDRTVNRGGPAAFTVSGQLAELRLQHVPNAISSDADTNRSLFQQLHRIITNCNNPYVQSFLTCKEFAEASNIQPEEIRFELNATERPNNGDHPGRYNLPTAPEISILMPNSIQNNATRSVTCSVRGHSTENDLQFFPDHHRSYDPLQYPLLFPSGQDGWHEGYTCSNGNKCTALQFARYHIMERHEEANLLHSSGKLFQQYAVDQFDKIDSQRLRYIQSHQQDLRADEYVRVEDALHRDDVRSNGQAIILPASHTGSDRYMHRSYQNAMALIREFGKPILFITMTCNIHWPEIQSRLKPPQSAYDRPDIVARVFYDKLKAIFKDFKAGIFGEYMLHTYSIEFQKRGAPHAHILLWIRNFVATDRAIDEMISAEIPPENSGIRESVIALMIHGPCGEINPQLGCMRNGTCDKQFPKTFCDATRIGDDSYPTYRRRSPEHGGQKAVKYFRGHPVDIDNRFVVPYSPYLIRKYNCHINVEHCASIQSMKYVFKYQFKGSDMVTVELTEGPDEIKSYQTKRYVSSIEAMWRMFEFPICKIKPSVMQLPVHLERQQTVIYNATPEQARQALDTSQYTALTEYFATNARDPDARQILYEDFPKHYVWYRTNHLWSKRNRITDRPAQLGRMVSIHPAQMEKFYLRLILKHKVGATSFTDLRTIDGIEHLTFKAPCIALELLQDDQQWYNCLMEATAIAMPSSIRQLFATILLECEPTDSTGLFEAFQQAMYEDFLHALQDMPNLTDDEKMSCV